MLKYLFIMTALLAAGVTPLKAEEVTLAVAANFTGPMQEIVAQFQAQSGHKVLVSYGSSGRIYAQIINGAPFEIFFSADQEKPAALIARGLAPADSRFTYATGSLVLWSADTTRQVNQAAVLRGGSVTRLAIANPRLAPYGAAAIQVLAALGLEPEYRDRLVMGENINQAFQFVDTGNAPVGLVALSQVMQGGEIHKGAGWIVPAELYDPIRQDAVIMKAARDNPAAREFMVFMHGAQAKSIMTKYGYRTD